MRFSQYIRQIRETSGELGLLIGLGARRHINLIPLSERAAIMPSYLKGQNTLAVDAIGEKYAIQFLEAFAKQTKQAVRLIIDPSNVSFKQIGTGKTFSYCVLDPIDGTLKLTGLDNGLQRYRLINDGQWAFGIAFTDVTSKSPAELRIGDFNNAAIVDGNYSMNRLHPTNAFTNFHFKESKRLVSLCEFAEKGHRFFKEGQMVDLALSSQVDLSKGFLRFDSFQAFDRNSAKRGIEEQTFEVFRQISNRNAGGAFDIIRSYGDFADMLRTLIGYKQVKGKTFEPQTVGWVSMNNNLMNIVPTYGIIKSAKGFVSDFKGNDIGKRKISEGRVNMIYAANEAILEKLVSKLHRFA